MYGADNPDLGQETIPLSNIATVLSDHEYGEFLDIYEICKEQHMLDDHLSSGRSPAPTPGFLPPEPLYAVTREQLARDWQQWIECSQGVVEAHKNHVSSWKIDEEVACQSDTAEIQLQIKELEKDIIERTQEKEATIRKVTKQSNEWIEQKECAIKEALQTVADMELTSESSAPVFEKEEEDEWPQNAPPRDLCCPITLDLMKDPVIAMDGHTYERSAIEQVLEKDKPVSPCTNLPLINRTLIQNVTIRSMCLSWKESQTADL